MTDLTTALAATTEAVASAPADASTSWRLTATYVVDEVAREGRTLDEHSAAVGDRLERATAMLSDLSIIGEGATDTVTVAATLDARTHGAAVSAFVLLVRAALRALRADTSDVRVTIEPLGSGVPE